MTNLYNQQPTQQGAPIYGVPTQAAGALSWDTGIEALPETTAVERHYINLVPGYYDATIDFCEKGMHGNTGKIGACPQVTIHAHIDTQEGPVEISDVLYLHESTKLGLSLFFTSCGIDLNGKTYGQAFDEAQGKMARVEIQERPYTNRNGEQKILHNDIKRWVRHQQAPTTAQATAYPQTQQQPVTPYQPQTVQPATYQPTPTSYQPQQPTGAIDIQTDDLPF